MSPTSRTLKLVREEWGWTVDIVERFIPPRTRKDLFGFADLFAFYGNDVSLIQVTSTSNMSSRFKNITSEPCAEVAQAWLRGNQRHIYVIGWKRYAQRVQGRAWRPTIRTVSLGDFEHAL